MSLHQSIEAVTDEHTSFRPVGRFHRPGLRRHSLAVFPEADGIPSEQMLPISREMNLSETVFVLKPEPAKATNGETVVKRLRISCWI